MPGPASSLVGGVGCAVWRASCRLSPRRVPSVRGRKPSQARRRTSVEGAGEVAAVVAGKRPVSRFSPRDRVAAPLTPASAHPGNGVRAHPSEDAIGDPTPSRDPPPQGGKAIPGERGRDRSSPGRRESSRTAAEEEAADGGVGLALEDRRVKAEHRAPVADRRPADATDPAEFAGIEWSSEALA